MPEASAYTRGRARRHGIIGRATEGGGVVIYVLFFYDMAMTMANMALCVAFAALYVHRRSTLHLWLAILFGLCTLDIVLMYLFDFVPEFRATFSAAPGSSPFVYGYLHLAILLTFRLIAGFIFDRPPELREGALWILCCTYLAVAGSLAQALVEEFAENLCIGVLQLYIMGIGIKGLREGHEAARVLSPRAIKALVVSFACCSVGYLAWSVGSFAAGWESPRNVFVELSGGCNLVFACLYLHAYARCRREASAPSAVPLVAKRYDLTKREEEMLEMLAAGMSNQQIGSQAFISVGTVKTHAHNIYAKLGIKGRSDLASFLEQELSDSLDHVPHRRAGREREEAGL